MAITELRAETTGTALRVQVDKRNVANGLSELKFKEGEELP